MSDRPVRSERSGRDPREDERRSRERAPEADSERESAGEPPSIDEGRYVYCVVRTDDVGADANGETDAAAAFDVEGVEDEPARLVAADGIGAVVHACDEIYDSADVDRIRRWLVRHQSVVDEAADAFGTPLPFQFDTILRGGDEAVREWLRSEHDRLRPALERLADHWEYRIEVVRTEPVAEDRLLEDERLADLRERIDDAAEGAAFLLEKQYDRRLSERRSELRAERAAAVRERLADHVREVHELERSPSASLDDDATAGEDERETVCRLTVLAHEEREGRIGSVLDEVAAEPGIEVRFTGPWPPYTFTPAFGDDADGRPGAADGDR